MWIKLLQWLPKNTASVLGIVQVVIKFGKEVCTLALNIVAPIIPGTADDAWIVKCRDFFNKLDGWVEKVKSFLLKAGK